MPNAPPFHLTPPGPRRSTGKRKSVAIIDLTNSDDEGPASKIRKPVATGRRFAASGSRRAIATAAEPSSQPAPLARNTAPKSNDGPVGRYIAERGGGGPSCSTSSSPSLKQSRAAAKEAARKESPKKKAETVEKERRPKRFRDHAPQSVVERMQRCRTQAMFVLDRRREDEVDGLREVFKMAGSTGNVYTVVIEDVPNCDCPDGIKTGTCKHILYIMIKVLHAREDLVYQAGLLQSELDEIFTNAPPAPTIDSRDRKPLEDEDCPICYNSFQPKEKITWCKKQCGTNIHEKCFQQWAATRKYSGQQVTCVMCRQPWGDTTSEVVEKLKSGLVEVSEEGYFNVGEVLGLSEERDESSYHYNDYRYRSYYRRRRY